MERINEVTQDCFAALLHLRQAEAHALPAPELLHSRLKTLIDEMAQRASEKRFGHQDAQDITYAVVALADEICLNKPEPVRDYWMGNMLQFHYFQENLAGDGFFHRLQG